MSAEVQRHYDNHLAPIYVWMVGDVGAALQRNRDFFAAAGLKGGSNGVAVDLGCGFGLQAIPLAELGYKVTALDFSAELLTELRASTGALPMRVIQDDLLHFPRHLTAPAEVIVCMGDTLTHLPSRAAVSELLERVTASLAPGGLLALTFRDYVGAEPKGVPRFIPVRSDDTRILTCFLEYGDGFVDVHDLVHIRTSEGWRQSVSSYRKLRLDRHSVAAELSGLGFAVVRHDAERGLVTLLARKPPA
ncbi:MAG TPA: class I SAM-dependent methyltransferase [Candidatus Limnocylindria bacterium]|jgi:SAM-dependent methyltransferase|nr:class I SAM-dependent methyltransferase [Candidatus Limnocylindria bacterium]